MLWKTRRRTLNLTHGGVVMGILNATPDSFSDGGCHARGDAALRRALEMVGEGAEIIDIGGESTRPGSEPVSVREETQRVAPLVKALRAESDVLVSVDTSKPEVAEAALDAGADIINDVTGFRDDRMIPLSQQSGAGICIMHMLGEPRTMQQNPDYSRDGGVVAAVQAFFKERLKTLTEAGIEPGCICFDPGIGFGKTLAHNLELLRHLPELQQDRPVLLGISRKSFIGQLTGEQEPRNRDHATAAITAMTCRDGIMLHRVHNVAASVHALKLAAAFSR